MGTGRVCGTAAGIEPMLTHSITPSRLEISTRSSPSSRHRKSGSGPENTRTSRSANRFLATESSGQVSSVRVPSTMSSTGRRDR